MSQEALEEVLRKASSDAQFRNRLQTDLEGAVRGFDLSAQEKQQLRTGAGDRAVPVGAAPQRQAASLAASNALAQSAVDRFKNAAYDFVMEGESYRPRLKPKLDPADPPPETPAAKVRLHPRSRARHRR